MSAGVKKIAIINLTRMGDLLMTAPMIERLREIYPGREIHLFAVISYMPIVEGMGVDKIIPFNFSHFTEIAIEAAKGNGNKSLANLTSEFKAALKQYFEVEYEAIFNVSHTDVSLLFSYLLNGPVLGGLSLDNEGYKVIAGTWARYFFAGNLNRSLNPFHLVDVMVGTGNGLGNRKSRSRMRYDVTEEARLKVAEEEKTLLLENETAPRIVIQCGASEDDKRWEAEKFGEVGRLLFEKLGAHVLFVGTEPELPFAEQAVRVMGDGATILAGRTDLPLLAAWLESADLLITNDTGTMHLAQAAGTKSVVVTLGTALSDETAPYGEGSLIVEPDISCFPCNFQVNCPHLNCHNNITAETIAKLAADMINDAVPEKYGSEDIGSRCVVWKTGFDIDGWWRKIPISTVQPDRHRIIREIFRELWKASFEKSLRPSGPDADRVAAALSCFYGEIPQELAEKLVSDDLPGVKKLAVLAREGLKPAAELAEITQNPDSPYERIREIGGELFELDKRIEDVGVSHDTWRPLLMMFHFGKENLSPGDLHQQAMETVELYRDLERNSESAAELLMTALLIWSGREEQLKEIVSPQEKLNREATIAVEKSQQPIISDRNERAVNGSLRYSALYRPRMKGSRYHILMPVNGYYIQSELSGAFRRLGHRVTEFNFKENSSFIKELLEASLSADLLVTINHLGFDQHGELASLLEGIGLPYVSWYVDRPGFILLDYSPAPSETAFIFTWERSTIDEIATYGFEHIDYLPLAVDTERFNPGPDGGEGRLRWVANSMLYSAVEWQQKAGVSGENDPLFIRAVMIQRSCRVEALAALEVAAGAEGRNISDWSKHRKLTYASAVALTATRELRREIALKCAPLGLTLYGDDGWKNIAPEVQFNGMVKYPEGLPAVYRGGIHINATSYQMPTGLNQRVFDIPVSGGILVTDDQEDISELFDVDHECIIFSNPEESAEKAAYLIEHPGFGEKVMNLTRKRILKEHTYDRRAKKILKRVHENVGSTMVAVEGGIK